MRQTIEMFLRPFIEKHGLVNGLSPAVVEELFALLHARERAIDAEYRLPSKEEREAWDRYLAAMIARGAHRNEWVKYADEMLEARRTRFGKEGA